MQIAIDVRSLMEGRLSGVEVYTTEIIRGMVRIAPHHTYHLFYNSYKPVTLPTVITDLASTTAALVIHHWSYPNKIFNLLQLTANLPRWDTLLPAVDCVFIPNVRLMPLSSAIPLVVTAHDVSFERFPEFFSYRRRVWHRAMRPRHLMTHADHVIADSQATAHDVMTLYGVSPAAVSVVYPGVADIPATSDMRVTVRDRYKLPEHFLLYFGAFEPRKNIASIIRAYSAIADRVPHDLVLAGSPGWLMNEVAVALQESPVRQRIHRLGFIPEVYKRSLYELADLFVYPSFYEGFGFPPLEALLAGTPVITSANSSLPEVVGEWATLVNPYDRSELAQVMQELLEHPPVVTAEHQRAIRQRYSWDRAAKQTIDIITNIV